jgi:branched-chain amino acid transport system ATP-binding protein
MDVCDSITVLDFGRVIADGTPAKVSKDAGVIAAYLGEDDTASAPAYGDETIETAAAPAHQVADER